MKAYVVGGAVRDELLGLPLQDKDYVVVGATAEEMVKQGFKPVGKDFPVFLHPKTHEEYALARTERKSGRGYKGFTVYAAPDVTLEDDLRRRDLTINAMAKAAEGTLIDPFGGRKDLEAGVLRHVSEAFAEDPVRILRVARFAARFGFRVADETLALMKRMVDSGEADYLVPERVWQEFARGLAEPHPEKMFEVLEACGLADKLLDGVKPVAPLLTASAKAKASVPVRFAVIAWPYKEPEVAAVCERLKAPNDVRELALLGCRSRVALRAAPLATPAALLELLKRTDALRRPERFRQLLEAVDAGAIAAKAASADEIPRLIDEARVRAIGLAG
jgi:tRNA nucleotidyltransferase (CCA-adding enzyme)